MTDQPSPAPPEDPRIADLERRLVQAELKSHALGAGIVDLDGLKLIDPAKIKLSSTGQLENAEHLMMELRRNKPWLFHAANSSTTAAAPPTTPPVAKSAKTMTHPEWQAARAELLKRR